MSQVRLRWTGAADGGFQTILNNVESSMQNRPTLPSSVRLAPALTDAS